MVEIAKLLSWFRRDKTPVPPSNPPQKIQELPQIQVHTYEELMKKFPPRSRAILELIHFLADEEERAMSSNGEFRLNSDWGSGINSARKKLNYVLETGYDPDPELQGSYNDYLPFSWFYVFRDGREVGSTDMRLVMQSRAICVQCNLGNLIGMDEYLNRAFGHMDYPIFAKDWHSHHWENTAYKNLGQKS